jgi:hypothetical protein
MCIVSIPSSVRRALRNDLYPLASHTRRSQTQKIRSAGVSGRRFGAERRRTASGCRQARFSSRRWAEDWHSEVRAHSTARRRRCARPKSRGTSIHLKDGKSIGIFWRDRQALWPRLECAGRFGTCPGCGCGPGSEGEACGGQLALNRFQVDQQRRHTSLAQSGHPLESLPLVLHGITPSRPPVYD